MNFNLNFNAGGSTQGKKQGCDDFNLLNCFDSQLHSVLPGGSSQSQIFPLQQLLSQVSEPSLPHSIRSPSSIFTPASSQVYSLLPRVPSLTTPVNWDFLASNSYLLPAVTSHLPTNSDFNKFYSHSPPVPTTHFPLSPVNSAYNYIPDFDLPPFTRQHNAFVSSILDTPVTIHSNSERNTILTDITNANAVAKLNKKNKVTDGIDNDDNAKRPKLKHSKRNVSLTKMYINVSGDIQFEGMKKPKTINFDSIVVERVEFLNFSFEELCCRIGKSMEASKLSLKFPRSTHDVMRYLSESGMWRDDKASLKNKLPLLSENGLNSLKSKCVENDLFDIHISLAILQKKKYDSGTSKKYILHTETDDNCSDESDAELDQSTSHGKLRSFQFYKKKLLSTHLPGMCRTIEHKPFRCIIHPIHGGHINLDNDKVLGSWAAALSRKVDGVTLKIPPLHANFDPDISFFKTNHAQKQTSKRISAAEVESVKRPQPRITLDEFCIKFKNDISQDLVEKLMNTANPTFNPSFRMKSYSDKIWEQWGFEDHERELVKCCVESWREDNELEL